MRSAIRILATLCLLGPFAAFAASPSPTWVTVPLLQASPPGHAFFSAPQINRTTPDALAAVAPHSAVSGLNIGQPAPAFQTLKSAAAAGINPLAQSSLQPAHVLVLHSSPLPRRAAWPAAFGLFALIFSGLIAYIAFITRVASSGAHDEESG